MATGLSRESGRVPDPECTSPDEQDHSTNKLEGSELPVLSPVGNNEIERSPDGGNKKPLPRYLVGLRFHAITVGICLSLFLVNLEVSIVSTSLVAITNDLQGFLKANWIITGYLVTYTGFIIISAKLSDIYGRKTSIISTLLLFVAFSAGCGAARTIDQLIICRVFQGIGGAGCYSLAIVILFELVPHERYAIYGGLLSACVALATLLGPILGGVINNSTTWRWIFLLNIPLGAIAIVLLAVAIPHRFPQHSQHCRNPQTWHHILSAKVLWRVDFLGAFLLLSATLLFATALSEAYIFLWSSAVTIVLLVLSVLLCIAFFAWEYFVSKETRSQEPVFPWRFMRNRLWLGLLLISLLVGIPFNVLIVDIPQRLQAVNGVSPLGAGLRLIPYTFITPLGSLISNVIASKKLIIPIYLLLIGSTLQLLGVALMTTLPVDGIPAAQYGYEVIAGFGVGTTFGILLLITPFAVDACDLATATGATIQFRMLGGAIGLATASSIVNGLLTSGLSATMSAEKVNELLQQPAIIASLDPETKFQVQQIFAGAYGLSMKVVTGLASAQFLGIAMMWKREQLRLPS